MVINIPITITSLEIIKKHECTLKKSPFLFLSPFLAYLPFILQASHLYLCLVNPSFNSVSPRPAQSASSWAPGTDDGGFVVPTHKQAWQQLQEVQGGTFSFGPKQALESD